MIAKHKWGTPISEEAFLNLSAIDGDYPAAREVSLATRVFLAMITTKGALLPPYTV